jgi:hypothetical protein
VTAARTYRFNPPDRTGWLLGLGGPQVVALGGAVVVAVLLASAHAPLPVLAAPIALGAALAFTRVGGQPLLEAAPPAIDWLARRARREHRWLAPLPLPVDGLTPPLPPGLAGQVLLNAGGVAVVCDRRTGRYSATIRVTGGGFALAERVEQERLLAGWGDALAPFCRDRGTVVAVRWSEWAAPAGIEDQLAFLAEHGHDDPDDPAVASYRRLLASAGPLGMRHDTLITLVVGADRLVTAAKGRDARDRAGVDALLAELHLFTTRLENAGLTASLPLTPPELGRALRVRLDPGTLPGLDRRGRTLGQLAGLVRPANAGPLATEARWSAWRADGAWHRAFWMCDWPRLDVGPMWLADLLLARVGVRTVSVWYEPVPPRASRRAIERAAAKLDSDEDHRHRVGLRVGAGHRRAQSAVAEREAELVAGYPEFTYAGVVTVTAADRAGLDASSAEIVQTAAAVGVDLRPLHGRHDRGVAATLPLARGLAPRLVT